MKDISKLENTIEMMLSDDHYERLLAEYHQTRIRCQKLDKIINDYNKGVLTFTPKTPIHMLKDQREFMEAYLLVLKLRLHIESDGDDV